MSAQPVSEPSKSEPSVPEPITAEQPASEALLLEWFTPEELAAEAASTEPAVTATSPPRAEAESAPAQTPPEATPATEASAWEPRVLAAPPSPAQAAAAREAEYALRFEPWLTEHFAEIVATLPLSDADLRALRVLSDLLALWALCEEPACRREGTCRGREPHCFGDVGPLVPACALPFFAGFVAGQLDRLPFDAALARLPEGAFDQWAHWHAAVAQITGRAHYPLCTEP